MVEVEVEIEIEVVVKIVVEVVVVVTVEIGVGAAVEVGVGRSEMTTHHQDKDAKIEELEASLSEEQEEQDFKRLSARHVVAARLDNPMEIK